MLARLGEARVALAEVETVEEALRLAGFAESIRYAARQAKAGVELENAACEVRLRAERRAGELLAAAPKARGGEQYHDEPSTGTRWVPVPTLADLGVSKKQSATFQAVAAVPEPEFERYVAAADGRLARRGLLRAARRTEVRWVRERLAAAEAPLEGEAYRLLFGAVGEVDPGEVDAIVTDPPYGRDALGVYEQLAAAAARRLRPAGSLFAMVGQAHLPEVLAALCAHLDYRWTLAYLTPGGQSPRAPLAHVGVNSFWKPVVWLSRGEPSLPALGDVVRTEANENEKDAHDWQQSVGGFRHLVRLASRPGDVVWDPFCGSGTTGVAAVALGRKFVGSDVDEAALAVAAARILGAT